MARSTKTQKALNLNAAHGLLSRGSSVAEAATILVRERGTSLRQAYRYLQGARALGRAMPVGEPSVPATFKIPRDVLAQLRAYSRRSGLPLSVVVTEAIAKRLTASDFTGVCDAAGAGPGCWCGSAEQAARERARLAVGCRR
jgi:hypothetical protein